MIPVSHKEIVMPDKLHISPEKSPVNKILTLLMIEIEYYGFGGPILCLLMHWLLKKSPEQQQTWHYIYIYTYTYTYIYIHKYTYIYIHTYIQHGNCFTLLTLCVEILLVRQLWFRGSVSFMESGLHICISKLGHHFFSNRPVSLMWAPLVACRDLALDYNIAKAAICF